MDLDPKQIEHLAEEAAEKAAEKAFRQFMLVMGVDASKPEQLLELQQDIRHLRKWRRATDTVSTTSVKVAVTIVLTGLLGALWLGLQALLHAPVK